MKPSRPALARRASLPDTDQVDPAIFGAPHSTATLKTAAIINCARRRSGNRTFVYRYLLLTDQAGTPRALQPFFFTDQDILAGLGSGLRAQAERIRRASFHGS